MVASYSLAFAIAKLAPVTDGFRAQRGSEKCKGSSVIEHPTERFVVQSVGYPLKFTGSIQYR